MGSEKTRKRHVGNSNRKRYENSDPSRKRPSSKSNGDSRTHNNDDGDSSPKLFTILFVIVAVLFVIVGVFGFLVFAEYLDLRTYLAFLRTNELKARSNSDKNEPNKNSQPENKQNSEEPAKNSRPGSSTEERRKSPTDVITNAADLKILSDIIKADTLLEKGKIEAALKKYDEILAKYPSSSRGTFGKANALNKQSEKLRSNPILEQCIAYYQKVVDLPDVPKPLLLKAADIAVERMNFRGWNGEAVRLRAKLAKMFPGDLSLMNNLGVSLLMIGSNRKAKLAFEEVLEKDPQNGFAQAHYGFILKTDDQNFPLAIRYLKSGLASKQPGTNKGLFYVHLGDALNRNGQKNESYDVFREGQKNGHFFSVYQRSLYNVDRLTGQPIWTRQQTGYQKYFKLLEDNWKLIRDEGLKNMDVKKGAFVSEEENLRETGDWKQFTLWAQETRRIVTKFRKRVP
ncbi:aspartyl/asparaginyl beta-hydroxylase-like isoform X2 [Tubulanus polymorphus]|uniref:aspartyl/asparaginyl beta-hydroxylase-like isoform X2 n=1 Tax=Tubulanus polymorphus TaxID=672921 RepID=UPI003DA498D2